MIIQASILVLGASMVPLPHPAVADERPWTAAEHVHDAVAYLYAVGLEHRWSRVKVQTRDELEEVLWLYSVRAITPLESGWGRAYELKPGEKMVQYLLLWRAPLDVVYDSSGAIKAIFTSYE